MWDEDESFAGEQKFHSEFVEISRLEGIDSQEQTLVHSLLEQHSAITGSRRAESLLANWLVTLRQIVRVAPRQVS